MILCDPMDCSPPSFSVPRLHQATILEWVAISFSRGSFQPRNQICVSCLLPWQASSLPLSPLGKLIGRLRIHSPAHSTPLSRPLKFTFSYAKYMCPITTSKHLNHSIINSKSQVLSKCHLNQIQFSSVAKLCPTFCDPMNRSRPGLPVHLQLPEYTQTHVHRVSDAIQPSHPLSSPSPPVPNPSQHQGLFQ